jgi:GT2 family glycosyltransferase
MDLSVIIVTFNSRADIDRCLASVEAAIAGLDAEICVVDNGSSDGTADAVRRGHPAVRVVQQANRGFAAGINAGLRVTTGRYVWWLNPDARVVGGTPQAVMTWFDAHAEAGIAGARVLDPGGAVQLSARAFPSYGAAFGHRYSLLTRIFPQNPLSRQYLRADAAHDTIDAVDWVSGACLLHRRAVSDRLGGLDEGFFMYCEDVDFCYRARQAGWTVYFHPGVTVEHGIGGSSRAVARRMIVARHRSIWRYYTKHFRRNWLKDLVTGAAIGLRCAWFVARGGPV